MKKRLSRFGVGPKIVLSAVLSGLVAGGATLAWPGACVVNLLAHPAAVAAAVFLLVAGVALWLTAAVAVMRAYNRDQLVTSGVFALARHPLYATWIVLILPGLVLLSRSWPLLVTPLVAYIVFKRLILREDQYLEERFGQAYSAYRSRVNELVPIPRFR